MTDTPIAYRANGTPIFDNTATVVCMLAVYGGKLLAVRRNNEPGKGLIGLPSGHQMNSDRTWQEAGCRELLEETGYAFDPAHTKQIGEVVTDEYGKNLIFAMNLFPLPVAREAVDPAETQEVLLLGNPGIAEDWAFPRHRQAALDFWNMGMF